MEMMNRNSDKKVFMFAACCAASLLGGYMTFFYKGQEALEYKKTDYQEKELSELVKETVDELYVEDGMPQSRVYFSNTKCLDEGNLPLEIHSVLVLDVQEFLEINGYKDVIELYLIEESYTETEESISFLCLMNVDGYEEMLQVEYLFGENSLEYHILPNSISIGAEDEEQRSSN